MYCYTYWNGTLTNSIDVREPTFITPYKSTYRLLFYTFVSYPLSHAKAGRTPVGLQLDQEGDDDSNLVVPEGIGQDKRVLLWLKDLPHPDGCWETVDSRVLAGDGEANTLLIVPDGGEVHFVMNLAKFDVETSDFVEKDWENVFTFTNHSGKIIRKETHALKGAKAAREGKVEWL